MTTLNKTQVVSRLRTIRNHLRTVHSNMGALSVASEVTSLINELKSPRHLEVDIEGIVNRVASRASSKALDTTMHFTSGFWTADGGEDGLPELKARAKPWKGRAAFLKALAKVESKVECITFKIRDACKLCDDYDVLYREFKVRRTLELSGFTQKTQWRWPASLSHYVKEHNVKPDNAFIRFITHYFEE